MRENHRNIRRIAASVSAGVAVLLFVVLGGAGLAQTAIGLAGQQYGHGAQYQYGKKMTICHKGKNTISISVNAWPAHLRHGDTEGPCSTVQAAGVAGAAVEANGRHGGKGKGKGTHSTGDTQAESGTSKKQKGGKGTHGVSLATEKGKPAKSKPTTSKPQKGTRHGRPSGDSGALAQKGAASTSSPKPKKEKKAKPARGGPAAAPSAITAPTAPGPGNGRGNGGGGRGNGGGHGKGKH